MSKEASGPLTRFFDVLRLFLTEGTEREERAGRTLRMQGMTDVPSEEDQLAVKVNRMIALEKFFQPFFCLLRARLLCDDAKTGGDTMDVSVDRDIGEVVELC